MSDITTSSPAPAPTTAATPEVKPRPRFRIDDRFIAPIFITAILFAGQITFHVLDDYWKTIAAIIASILTEAIIGKLYTGKVPHLASAYISGISVGILIRSPEVWPYVLTSMIAITSKYVIRYHGRHLWNPSNFAICAMLIIAHKEVATLGIQFGNTIWPMIVIWILGSLIIARLKRFHICLTYVGCFIAYSFLRSLITGNPFLTEVAPITGPMYQLFIFFMITDPKTTVKSKQGQMLVAFLVATAEFVLRLMGNTHAPYYALTLMGPSAYYLEIWKNSRKAPATPALKPA